MNKNGIPKEVKAELEAGCFSPYLVTSSDNPFHKIPKIQGHSNHA
jgi:hypothetical protein